MLLIKKGAGAAGVLAHTPAQAAAALLFLGDTECCLLEEKGACVLGRWKRDSQSICAVRSGIFKDHAGVRVNQAGTLSKGA